MKSVLFEELFPRGESIRLIGVGVSNLSKGESHQMNLFEWQEQKEKDHKLKEMMKEVKEKFGESAINRGGSS